jgi:hypothetical protein
MLGINDAESFKTQILAQREKVINQKHGFYGNCYCKRIGVQQQSLKVIDNTQLLTSRY